MKRRLVAALVLTLCRPASAEDASLPPRLPLRVLRAATFHDGSRTITVNRVAPPTLTAPARPAEPPPQTEQELETEKRRANKRQQMLSLSATILDRELTVLRWSAEGRSRHAFSSIDFNYLRAVSEIETDDTVFWLFFGFGEATREEAPIDSGVKVPSLAEFIRARSHYVLAEESPSARTDPMLAGLDALHAYFDAHRAELIAAWEQREAVRIEHERWQRERPPTPPPPLVVHFWPGKNTVVFDAPAKGGTQ
jgi:hypothetical protein